MPADLYACGLIILAFAHRPRPYLNTYEALIAPRSFMRTDLQQMGEILVNIRLGKNPSEVWEREEFRSVRCST
jgi:hypothetical protein